MINNYIRKKTTIKCVVCGKNSEKELRIERKQLFCSRICANSRLKGTVSHNRGKSFPYHPRPDMRGKKPWNYGKKFPEKSGPNSHLWRGGTTQSRMKIQSSYEYRMWRRAIFERDNFTCQHCFNRGGDKHAHHIKSFKDFPELTFNIDNGLTLCIPCHKKTDSYPKNLLSSDSLVSIEI
jgi:hypothetical protein